MEMFGVGEPLRTLGAVLQSHALGHRERGCVRNHELRFARGTLRFWLGPEVRWFVFGLLGHH